MKKLTPLDKKALFEHYRKSLAAAELETTHDDSLICPLCWQETSFENLSKEHVVPGSVGGTCITLTCSECNNEHGSSLEKHLSKFQDVRDALKGHGTLRTKITVGGKSVMADLRWTEGQKDFVVVRKASNPAVINSIHADFEAGRVPEFNFTLLFGFAKNNFQTAVLRAAYLILFKCFGYEYSKDETVQTIRRRICDLSMTHPRLDSLVVELRDCTIPYDEPYLVAPGNVNGVEFHLVIIRIRKSTTTYLGAYLPTPSNRSNEFFELMEKCSREHNREAITIPTKLLFT